MKTEILSIEGKKTKEVELPAFFSYPIREDIISKVLEAKKQCNLTLQALLLENSMQLLEKLSTGDMSGEAVMEEGCQEFPEK